MASKHLVAGSIPAGRTHLTSARPAVRIDKDAVEATLTATDDSNAASPESLREPQGCLTLLIAGGVRVDRHRDLNAAMAGDGPDDVRRHPGVDEEGHAGVPQVVQSHPRQTGPLPHAVPVPIEVAWLERTAVHRSEHQTRINPRRTCGQPVCRL